MKQEKKTKENNAKLEASIAKLRGKKEDTQVKETASRKNETETKEENTLEELDNNKENNPEEDHEYVYRSGTSPCTRPGKD